MPRSAQLSASAASAADSSRHASRSRGGARPSARADKPAAAAVREAGREVAARYTWAAARIALGSIFLWAFLDKFFGLGHETASADSVLNGGNPTKGFLANAVGPFDGIYHGIAGNVVVNVLFMGGLLALGVALIGGIAMRFAAVAGALMMVLMWSASLPPANHVFMDDHLVYAIVLVGLALVSAGDTLGLGRRWSQLKLVQRLPWLR
ncbi:DoxX family membrane protein [Conexibacter stalactiti]|uniref:DoxX family membrane protein n=1 Tax=Conexibacter stalactiti TaxID=1940611 RepID=A0ABU4HK47_9ACTN|nr:DoxX family membrane protein [Conexibacter stalactiti]MDW5593683.1 DoxX family membrane protein [Conexibacter stalactiti]MEC5034324.1 DoxX family membrane protein [Conexibacter stalactiti]